MHEKYRLPGNPPDTVGMYAFSAIEHPKLGDTAKARIGLDLGFIGRRSEVVRTIRGWHLEKPDTYYVQFLAHVEKPDPRCRFGQAQFKFYLV